VDLRRIARPEPRDDPDPDLLDRIRAAIRRDGPMTFARFMELALYDPTRGYYRGAVARPGRAGDFLTAPEASPIFGRSLARFALGVHAALGRPEPFPIREHGAGSGALATPLVAALLEAVDGPTTVRYLVAEVEPARVAAVRRRFSEAGLDPVRATVEADDRGPIDGLAIANEVVDALPTHRVVGSADAMGEVFVGLGAGDALVDVEGDPSTPRLAERLAAEGVALEPGQRAEVCLALDGWVADAAAGIGRGVLLVIDYGHDTDALHDPRRRFAGTLVTYRDHVAGDDPYASVGRQDLTAHVDLTALDRAAEAAGLRLLGGTTQSRFLDALGAGELLVAEQTRPGVALADYLDTRAALVRLIDPSGMGGFAVRAYGRGLPDEARLPGFADAN
jgi:SAM-dependent MidA family methyltransferase